MQAGSSEGWACGQNPQEPGAGAWLLCDPGAVPAASGPQFLCWFTNSTLAQLIKNLPAMQAAKEMRVPPLCWEDRLEEGMAPTVFPSVENPMDRGAWWAPVHRVTKSQTPLSD